MRKTKKVKEEIKEEVIEVKDVPEFYILGIGETLTDVAKKYNLDVNKLKELNGDVIGSNQIKLK